MAKNEKTSARVAKIAAKVLAVDINQFPDQPHSPINPAHVDVMVLIGQSHSTGLKWSDIRALAASALTQTPDKRDIEAARKYLYNDLGFDPRDGGKVGRATHNAMGDRIKPRKILPPKAKCVLSARIKSKRPSSWPPSAKPGRNSP